LLLAFGSEDEYLLPKLFAHLLNGAHKCVLREYIDSRCICGAVIMHIWSTKYILWSLLRKACTWYVVTLFSSKISEFYFTPSHSLEVEHFYSFVVGFRGVSKIAKSNR